MSNIEDPIPLLLTSGAPNPLPHCVFDRSAVNKEGTPILFGDVGSSTTHNFAPCCVIYGDAARLKLQSYIVVQRGAIIRPPLHPLVNQQVAQSVALVNIGCFTIIGVKSVCEAAEIGNFVRIDEQCVIGSRVRIPDGVWIRPRSWIPPDAVLTPYTIYEGSPAVSLGRIGYDAYRLQQMEFIRECGNW
ncbi:unnamed protein product [Phytomonas sp. Hart1]|nr:unnamed protein product [Phytomonas sp. Hart1]|eukprot:CCW67974.1 unnamed protein product [Phytomonas sp. isolate Hart1]